ncbi:MAG: TerC family protein [Planctomycetia bacterium]|nr:TerC family protein [Planctomycetia bacterium]
MVLALLTKIAQIILIDIVLSGDNAVVIAMAAHKLPDHQRKQAILWGGAIAIIMRIMFTLIMAFLLLVPGVRFVGGLVLIWIACKLLMGEDDDHEIDATKASRSTWAAIRMIFVADFVMSLDNMLAVAGAAGEEWWMIIMGLLVSIAIIMFFSAVIARLMNRYHWIVYAGAAILAFTAGEMILGDRELANYIAVNHRMSLNKEWEEKFMLTHEKVSMLRGADDLPEDLQDVVQYHDGKLEFIGQMTEQQRDDLLARVDAESDKEAISHIYEVSHKRDVPDWVPANWRPRVENWFQRRWPADVWRGVQGRQYHFVAWIFYAAVVAFCLAVPYLLRRRKKPAEGAGHAASTQS